MCASLTLHLVPATRSRRGACLGAQPRHGSAVHGCAPLRPRGAGALREQLPRHPLRRRLLRPPRPCSSTRAYLGSPSFTTRTTSSSNWSDAMRGHARLSRRPGCSPSANGGCSRAYERHAYAACDLVFAVSEARRHGHPRAHRTSPSRFGCCRSPSMPQGLVPVGALTSDPVLLFVGGLHWPPNADAARLLRQGDLAADPRGYAQRNVDGRGP